MSCCPWLARCEAMIAHGLGWNTYKVKKENFTPAVSEIESRYDYVILHNKIAWLVKYKHCQGEIVYSWHHYPIIPRQVQSSNSKFFIGTCTLSRKIRLPTFKLTVKCNSLLLWNWQMLSHWVGKIVAS